MVPHRGHLTGSRRRPRSRPRSWPPASGAGRRRSRRTRTPRRGRGSGPPGWPGQLRARRGVRASQRLDHDAGTVICLRSVELRSLTERGLVGPGERARRLVLVVGRVGRVKIDPLTASAPAVLTKMSVPMGAPPMNVAVIPAARACWAIRPLWTSSAPMNSALGADCLRAARRGGEVPLADRHHHVRTVGSGHDWRARL